MGKTVEPKNSQETGRNAVQGTDHRKPTARGPEIERLHPTGTREIKNESVRGSGHAHQPLHRIREEHPGEHEPHHSHGRRQVQAPNVRPSIASVVSMNRDNLLPDIHHQPKVAEHRGEKQKLRVRESVYKLLHDGKRPPKEFLTNPSGHDLTVSKIHFHKDTRSSEERRSVHIRVQSNKSMDTLSRDGRDSMVSGSEESQGSSVEKSDDEDAWDIFLDEVPGIEEEDLLETNPLYEMANVEIDVEESLTEMDETLKRSLEQARVTERERTVLFDKFGLFLQALVSFQENEVELIDNINMKAQIMDVLQTFVVDETKATDLMLTDQKTKEDINEFGIAESLSLTKLIPEEVVGGEEGTEGVKRDIGGVAIDEMAANNVRENLLLQKNKLEMQEQMKMIHLLEIKQLEFEKTLLTLHYSKIIKPLDLQKEMRELRKAITDMKIEISTMQQEIAQLQLDISGEEKALREDETIVNQLDLDTLTKQIEVTQNSAKPLHLSKDADREAHKLEQIQDTLQQLEEKLMAGLAKYRIFQGKIDQRNTEYGNMLKEEGRMNQARKYSQQETEKLLADLEIMQKKEQGLLNKCRLAIERIAYNVKLKKKLYDEHHTIYNETTRAQREYQKLERTIRLATDAHLNAKLAYEKMRLAFDATQPKGDSDNWDKLRRMFLHEIANLKKSLNKKLTEASIHASTVNRLQKKLNGLYEEQVHCGRELQELMRTTVRKRRERQDKAEQCIKLETQLYGVVTDMRMKKAVLEDCGRNERDLQRSITILQKRYSQVKIEKASVSSDLIQARQRVVEQIEKFKIANNEVESYINQSLDRTREISRIHYLLLNAGLARDSVRNDALRAVQKFRFHRIERDEGKMANGNTRREIWRLRGEVTEIRNRFEVAIQTSTKIAMSVRERTEEVCTFIERIQAYDMILLNGTAELRLRELEKSKLHSSLNEAKTHLFIVTSNEPDETKFVDEVEKLRLQFYKVTKERRTLEEDLSNITGDRRVRELHHNWIEERESVPLLKKKIHKLEGLLATQEVRILERDLSLKQVDELTQSSMEKANWLKQKYECEVKSLVGMRKHLYHLSNKIDGLICETSLAMSRAETAESGYMKEKKALAEAERRFELQSPPTREMEKSWNHKVWQDEMLRRSHSRGVGFLVKPTRLTGSAVIMERLRPKKSDHSCAYTYESAPVPFNIPIPQLCPKFPYKPRRRPLSCAKPEVVPLKTGLTVCKAQK